VSSQILSGVVDGFDELKSGILVYLIVRHAPILLYAILRGLKVGLHMKSRLYHNPSLNLLALRSRHVSLHSLSELKFWITWV
jgi:hypothetical protein